MNIAGFIDLSDLIGSLIGAFLGFAGAYWIFRKERLAGKAEGSARLRGLFEDMSELLKEANEGWKDRALSYQELHKKYLSDLLQLHVRPVDVNPDHLTLDRFDRLDMLDAFHEVLGPRQGREAGMLSLQFIDRMRVMREVQDAAIIAMMQDFNRYAADLDRDCHELRLALIGFESVHRASAPNNPAHQAVAEILSTLASLKGITALQWRELLLAPVSERIKANEIGFTDWFRFNSLVARASVTYGRLKRSGEQLADSSLAFCNATSEDIRGVPALEARMRAGLERKQ